MTLKALVVAAMLSAICVSPSTRVMAQSPTLARDARLERLERWLAALLRHNPGVSDNDAVAVGRWSNAELEILHVDATMVIKVLRAPELAAKDQRLFVTVAARGDAAARTVRYPDAAVGRLKQVACAIGGFLEAAPCEWARDVVTRDPVLASLSSAAAAVRRDMNANFIVRRGALLHSDIAILGLATPAALDLAPGHEPVRMSFSDGRQTALSQPDLHWEFARTLWDLVAAPGSMKPAPGGDAMLRRWYIATTAWMQVGGEHDNAHIDRARAIFPDDPDLAMLSGAQHEAYASASLQAAVRSAFLPTGVILAVHSEKTELRDAEKLLRRATELKPDLAEAQIRLGRVLSVGGRDAEAVEHLERGLAATDERLMRYYGSLFLGAAEAKLGHDEPAKISYERAAGLYPLAQSPLLGLSELARRAGRRDAALREMEKVYTLDASGRQDDPWWSYTYAQGRQADALLDALQKPFRLADVR